MTYGDSSLAQFKPDEMMDIMAYAFPRRNESSFAWKSMVSQHLALTGLRAFWPTSSSDENGLMYDLSGQARNLTRNGNPRYSMEGMVPFIALDGTGDYFSRADENGLDITGLELPIGATQRGLTMGGWCRFDNAAGSDEYILSKWDIAGDQRSYRLMRLADGTIQFSVSGGGTAATTDDIATTGTPAADEWFWAAGRFDAANQEIDVWYNDEVANLAVGVAASIHSGTANLNMGAYHNGNGLMTGRLSMQFLCAAKLTDSAIFSTFEQSRSLFGV